MIAGEPQFTTELECEVLGDFYDYSGEFTSGGDEDSCIYSDLLDEKGACVFDIGNILNPELGCIYGTRDECLKKTGKETSFNEGIYCSDSRLNTTCTPHERDDCIVGLDDVFWFDSCGNREEVKQQCDILNGTKCGIYREGIDNEPDLGEYVCRDLSCKVNTYGRELTKQNGESWCEYEGSIGAEDNLYSRAVIGSNQWMHYCLNGEEKVEPCENFRSEICVQENGKKNGEKFTNAECKPNDWESCIALNYKQEGDGIEQLTECAAQSNCFVKKGYLFDLCLPKYPAGFDIKNPESKETAGETCDIGTFTCVVVYQKKVTGGWKCVHNCDCEEAPYIQEMNEFCISLGDCGGYINTEGIYTSGGYTVKGAPEAENLYGAEKHSVFGKYIPGVNLTSRNFESGEELVRNVRKDGGKVERYDVLPLKGIFGHIPVFENIMAEMLRWRGIGKTKKKYVEFGCYPWTAPDGGDECDKCSNKEDEMHPCSKYKCQSLGKNCEFINEGTGHELCINSNPGDSSSPVIEIGGSDFPDGISYEVTDAGVNIIDSSNSQNCLEQFTEINLSIKTNEPSICKVSDLLADAPTSFDELTGDYFGDGNYLDYEHQISVTLPSIDSLKDRYFLEENDGGTLIPREYGNLNYYVICKDSSGNENHNSYVFHMCIEPGADSRAPFIKRFFPDQNSFVKYGEETNNLSIWTNEPSDCKWDIEDKNYTLMENNFSCFNEFDAKELFGWRCIDELTGITNESSNFYIRCKDKPWLPEDNETRNVNSQGRVYTIKKSMSPLSISKMIPENDYEFIVGADPIDVDLNIVTVGGALDGKSYCSFRFSSEDTFTYFLNTDSSNHLQPGIQREEGEYNVEFFCEDEAGNTVSNTTHFEIDVDTTGPRIIRYYKDSGLKIFTSESAQCKYSFNRLFKWDNSTSMGGSGKEHHIEWSYNTHYIQCEDQYGNRGNIIKLRPYL
jgi:hypothetical protein